jgi:predicted helicase
LCDEVINSEKVIPIYGDFFNNHLPENFFENVYNTVNGKTLIKYTGKSPRDYQQDCIDQVALYFEEELDNENNHCCYKVYEVEECVLQGLFHLPSEETCGEFTEDEFDKSRCYIELACGTGKTILSYWIHQEQAMPNGIIVVFVPSLHLLSQFYSDWVNQSYADGYKTNYLLIGSDSDIDDDVKEKANGLCLLTDPVEIRNKLTLSRPSNKLVVICTYQSSDKLCQAVNKEFSFDFGIFDEAHKTVGQKDKAFSRMLNDNNLVIKKRMFMTATPKISSIMDDNILSMDDEEYYVPLYKDKSNFLTYHIQKVNS